MHSLRQPFAISLPTASGKVLRLQVHRLEKEMRKLRLIITAFVYCLALLRSGARTSQKLDQLSRDSA